ncbi:Chlorophyll synthesis pathway, bchC [uncultured Eubacteriales bacterium]|uniref:Chlorophyll synthesis pathway, bchC n=1 Tax=uncultured Eubacteriales bacterium TaxID=172733 RepID=A0A212KEM1_9FIRM|nr:Chlorophyll synthesis pathway, bchC [uncultured Eubacteriales bacterium]
MERTMLQQIMTAPAEIRFDTVPIPRPQPGQALIKIKRIGVCGSDIHVYHGKHPYTKYPVTQGHEVSGQVAELGEGVTGLRVGQKVTIEPQVYCGHCHPCTHGKYNLCESLKVMGFQTPGTASEYFAVDAGKVTLLPDAMSYDEGAMIEPLAVTVHAAKRAGDVKGLKVCVLGCGPIGILLVQTLKAFGAAEVLATDISDYRLALAKECGADHVVNTRGTDFGTALAEAFGPDKADLIYDCAGNDITMDQAIQNARKGSTIILVAVYAGLAHCDLAKLNDSELDLNTTMMYRHDDYVDAIRFVGEGKIRLAPLMSKHFAFTDYADAYRYIDLNQEATMKVLVDVDPNG